MIQVLEQNQYFTIAVKPSGVSVHSTPEDPDKNNLVDLLETQLNTRLAPITRLDKPVYGLVVLSNDSEFITDAKIKKSYQAVVFGNLTEDLTINLNLTTKKYGKKVSQPAITLVKPIRASNDYTLVEITINTGRHHQIRRHLSLAGFPIVGDFRHGFKETNLKLQTELGTTLKLHLACSQIQVEYLKQKWNYTLALPEDWTFAKE